MTSIVIDSTTMPTTIQQTIATTEAIRDRAFELFEDRSGSSGSELSDWLQAEREIVLTTDVADKGRQFQASVALPGVTSGEIRVTAMPDAFVVQANRIYRRINLAAPVNTDKLTASFDGGILQLIAPKITPKRRSAAA